MAPGAADRKRSPHGGPRGRDSADELIDATWYAETFHLSSPRLAAKHFRDIGSFRCYAIAPDLAGSDGRTLTPWASELLLRFGVRIGAKHAEPLKPDDSRAIRALSIPDRKKRDIAVVTTVFGPIDRLLPVFPEWLEDADFYAFVDHSFDEATGWTLVHSNFYADDPRRRSRYIKTHLPLYFADYDDVLWIDANVFPCDRPQDVLKALRGDGIDFAAFRHGSSRSLIMEAANCIGSGKIEASAFFAQLNRFNARSETSGLPLFDTGVIYLRPKSNAVRQLCATWWREIVRGINEDQLCLPIAIAETEAHAWAFANDDTLATSRLFVRIAHEKDGRR